jgi:hypothetical protein
VKQQQHEMTVLKRRLDELQERHRSLKDPGYNGEVLLNQQHSYTNLSSVNAPYSGSPDGRGYNTSQQQAPTPRNLFPIPQQQSSRVVSFAADEARSSYQQQSAAAAAAPPPSVQQASQRVGVVQPSASGTNSLMRRMMEKASSVL